MEKSIEFRPIGKVKTQETEEKGTESIGESK